MHNEVEVIAQTCHAAKRAFAEATGNPGLPTWANSSEAQKNSTRNLITTELQQLRGNNPPGQISSRAPQSGGDDEEESTLTQHLCRSIVRGLAEAGELGQQQETAAAA